MPSARPLRTWLALRIALAGMLPLVVVAALVLGGVLPQLRADLEIHHQTLARAIAGQIEIHLLGAGRELRAIAQDFGSRGDQSPSSWFGPLDAHAGTGDVFAAIYITDPGDSVRAVGLPQAERGQRDDLLELDLSKWTVLREARERNEAVWSETFLSAVTGQLAVTLAIPVAEHTLVGEIAIDRLSEFIARSPAESGMVTMILDRRGQIIAHSRAALSGQQISLGHLPIVGDALQGRLVTRSFELDGERFVGTPVSVSQLGWIVLVAQPRSEAFRPFLSTLWVLVAGALVALLLAILVAWVLARGLARRIGRYAAQAHAIAEGDYDQPWPVSHIREFDGLAGDLDRMSLAIRQRERDLATSEARYRSVIGSAPVVIFQFDEQGVFSLSEGKGLASVGLAANEAVGQCLFELYRDHLEIREYACRAIGGETLHFISLIGETYFDTYFNPVQDSDGHIQVMGVAVDITERQRAEEALRQANLVVENSPAMLFRWKAEDGWPVAFVSHNVKQLGYSPEELLDGSFRFASLVYPEDFERIGHEIRGYTERGVDQFQQEYRVVAKDGAVRWIDDRTVVERNFRGEITHYQGIVIDITERKRAEKELQLAQLSILWSADAVFWITPDGRFINVNEQACDSLGYARDELLSMSVWDIDPDFSPQRWSPHWERTQQLKKRRFETRHRRKDGTIFPVEITANYIEYEGQEYDFAFVRDITERKRAEESLRRSNRQLRMLSDCNQALIRITDEMDLLTTICMIAVREGGYRMAWVGYAEQDASKTIRPMAHAGFEEGYLQNLNITWADDERGIGPMGTAIRTRRPGLVQNIAGDSRFAPWRAEAAQRGYAAVCALPLAASDQIFGALGIYSSAPDAFDAEEINLLSELASDLAFGIAVLRTRIEHERAEMALKEKTEELDRFFTVALDLLCIADTDGYFHRLNPQWEVVLGYSLSELKKERFLDLVHPDDQASTLAAIGELSAQKVVLNFVNRYRRKDGSYCWIEWKSCPIGNLVYVAARDITERKRAEKELQLARLSILWSADAVFWITSGGRFINVNEQACNSLGYARDELLSMSVWDIDPDFSPQIWSPHWERTWSLKKHRFETRHRRKDGTIFPVEITGNYIEYEGQEYEFAFVRDITERKRAEELLKASTERLRLALQAALMGTWEWDIMDNHVVWSTETQNIFGVGADGFGETYQAYLGFVAPEIREAVDDRVKQFLNSARAPGVIQYEHEIIRGDGKTGWVEVRGTLFLNEQNRPARMTGICTDITDRKRAETELARHREHLEELVAERAAELRQAMTQLVQSEKLAALGHLVAGMAHEINTPLGNARVVAGSLGEVLREFATTIESGGLRRSQLEAFLERGREAVDLLERNTARAADLIGQFKQVAVDQTSARRRRFDLRQTVEELLATLQPQFKHTAHRIELDIPPDIELDSYPGSLEQIFTNLLTNSLTHGFAGIEAGRIRFQVQTVDSTQVILRYADNGTGIPTAILGRIFDPFFTTRLGQGGSGLGLYIAYNLVTGVLGGAIRAESSPGCGAVFTLVLPIIAPDSRTRATGEVTP